MEFIEWLRKEKDFSDRASRDVLSRLKRVMQLIRASNIDKTSAEKLEKVKAFKDLTPSVKSQLRRSIKLYDEYKMK